ncbi:MAG TPA: F0F1 ATP synthase subunit gamma [Acidimicrobiales bacterium]|jgi:F-type H+-transporting ATPase subunit gamma|nr:F0F1 ATP synthase subunit gamma [Acidimicrobiales bacterium]
MPGGAERALRGRIRSVQSTKKITRAMELIAASRIVKAQARVAAARPYSEQITEVIRNLAAAGAGSSSPLLTPREDVRTVAYIVVAADRGLAGGYNSGVIRQAERSLQAEVAAGRDYKLFLIGKKAFNYFRFRGYRIEQSYTGFSDNPSYEDARQVAAEVVRQYEAGEVDQVQLVYTQFLSVATQRVLERRFIPMESAALTEGAAAEGSGPAADYEFEPAPAAILEAIVPRYVESRLYAAFLDAAASEHVARQRAMKSATDNADELIKVLTRSMNRARQDAITTELIEIASGAEALAQAASGSVDLLRDVVPPQQLMPQRHHDSARRIEQERS